MSSFSLNTGHTRPLSGFQNRTSDVFASLEGLEKNYDDKVKERGPDEFLDKDRDHSPERDGGFKRPAPPRHESGTSHREGKRKHGEDRYHSQQRGERPSGSTRGWHGKRQRTPDHQLHPERWTEYSLRETDVSSESGNKRAAVDFFRDLRARKAKEARAEEWDAELYCRKIEFKKPTSDESTEGSSSGSSQNSGSFSNVHKMPEYVIGQTKAKSGKSKSQLPATEFGASSCPSKSDISLGHLGSYEDGEQPASSSDSSRELPGRNDSSRRDSRTFPSEKTGLSVVASGEVSMNVEEGEKDSGAEPPKEDGITFKKGKGKRKIRERRDDDG